MVAFIGLNREVFPGTRWTLLIWDAKLNKFVTDKYVACNSGAKTWTTRWNLFYRSCFEKHDVSWIIDINSGSHLKLELVIDLMLLDPLIQIIDLQLERWKVDVQGSKNQRSCLAGTWTTCTRSIYHAQACPERKLAEPDKNAGIYKNLDSFSSKINQLLYSLPHVISKAYSCMHKRKSIVHC